MKTIISVSAQKTLSIKLPFAMRAVDYHEFDAVKTLLKQLTGKTVKFRELEDADELKQLRLKVHGVKHGTYVAVFG